MEERNFRTDYYEKMGLNSVDERKSIEILLKEDPISLDKLRQFSLRFPIPAMYRIYVWKILLGILPVNHSSQEFVLKQRREQYENLEHALKIMRLIDHRTPDSVAFFKMFLIEEGLLMFQNDRLEEEGKAFLLFASSFQNFGVESDVDIYWFTVSLYRSVSSSEDERSLYPQKTEFFLTKDEIGKKLLNHLIKIDAWNSIPLTSWFNSCFVGVLTASSLERVWDKVISGSLMILVFVATSILLRLFRPLMAMTSSTTIVSYLEKLPEDTCELSVSSAIDMWQKNGFHLLCGKSDSPISDKTS